MQSPLLRHRYAITRNCRMRSRILNISSYGYSPSFDSITPFWAHYFIIPLKKRATRLDCSFFYYVGSNYSA